MLLVMHRTAPYNKELPGPQCKQYILVEEPCSTGKLLRAAIGHRKEIQAGMRALLRAMDALGPERLDGEKEAEQMGW